MKAINSLQAILMLIALHAMSSVNAQIVYTNIKPDIKNTCNHADCSKSYSLDLNNDGVSDFNILASFTSLGCVQILSVGIEVLNGNSVAVTTSTYASKLFEPALISSATLWSSDGSTLRTQFVNPCYFNSQIGNWNGSADGYLGLKMLNGGNTYYGWARLKVTVSNSSASFTIKDYAYDSTPNHSIETGDKSGERLVEGNSLNENNLTLNVFPNPVSHSAVISFSLFHPQNVSLKIFDVSGRLIEILADKIFEEGDNELEWNASYLTAGVYLLQFRTAGHLQSQKLIVTK